ncbi:MAG: hypothetical protein L3K03_05600 [Thermoplasmata archaeon]|nr:hypothetical protein [Thermoplasmata archaeon]
MAPKVRSELPPPVAMFVERKPVPVFRYPADMTGAGPKPAFEALMASLPSTMDREIYGTFLLRDGPPEYFACATRHPDDPEKYSHLDSGVIPGGLYVRRIFLGDWRDHITDLPRHFQRMVEEFHHDASRPSIELYGPGRLQLFLPTIDRLPRDDATK